VRQRRLESPQGGVQSLRNRRVFRRIDRRFLEGPVEVLQRGDVRGFADVLLQLPSGLVLVVDYKKSSSGSRVKRMEKGYDIQASLYRMMISTSEVPDEIRSQPVGVMYYLLNDQQLLSDTTLVAGRSLPGLHVLENDISAGAQALLEQRFAELAAGSVRLNFSDDMKVIERETGIKPYALERSPLLQRFCRPESDR